jgi:SAM-dependent methyltransferase
MHTAHIKTVPFAQYIQPDNKNLFEVFVAAKLDIDWKNAKILDYGSNQGNFLNSALTHINSEKYLGVDILEASIHLARQKYPDCNFLHYDRWHQAWNPSGNKNISITDIVTDKFDVIIAYSVFTHTTIEQTRFELDELKKLLTPNGVILFTIWSSDIFRPFHDWVMNLNKVKSPIIDFENITFDNFSYWIDERIIITDQYGYKNDVCSIFNTFYNLDFFKEKFADCVYIGRPINQYQELFCL